MQKSIEFFVSRCGDTACVIKRTDGAKTTWHIGFAFLAQSDAYNRRMGRTISFARAYAPTRKIDNTSSSTSEISSHKAALIECLFVDFVAYAPSRFISGGYATWANDVINGAPYSIGEKSTWPLGELKKAGMTTANQDHAHVFNDGAWEVVYK